MESRVIFILGQDYTLYPSEKVSSKWSHWLVIACLMSIIIFLWILVFYILHTESEQCYGYFSFEQLRVDTIAYKIIRNIQHGTKKRVLRINM